MGTSNLPRLTFSTSISFPTPTNSTKALLCVPPRASSQESTLSKHHHKQPKDTSAHPNQSPLPNSPCQHPASPPPPPPIPIRSHPTTLPIPRPHAEKWC